jgi:2-iminobutanoate/2-iminopropanoate deaminase
MYIHQLNSNPATDSQLYSDAVIANGFVFTTGQMPLDSKWNLISDDFDEQARYVFEKLSALLEQAGTNTDALVKVTIYLADIEDVARLQTHRRLFLGNSRPASVIVQVGKFGVEGMKVEAEAIAVMPN